jgi:hypothetical protein
MNVKTKTALIIIATLIIGIAIGAMLNRALLQHRIKRTFSYRNPDRLPVFYERILDPNVEQTQKIRSILKKHAVTISKIRNNYQEEMLAANESFKTELDPLLTPAQKRRLNRGPFNRWQFLRREGRLMNLPQKDNFIQSRLSFLKKELSLTEVQAAQVKQILGKHSLDQYPKRVENRLRNQKPSSFIKEIDRAIQEILTEKQKIKYMSLQKERPINKRPF